jgi:proteasome lid subunit RPN8/RPN11
MRNFSFNKVSHFSLHSRTLLLRSKIHSVFHSHPTSDAYPSERDISVSSYTGLPFLIYSCLYDNFLFFDTQECNVVRE